MAIVTRKNIAINTAAVSDVSYGNGVTGYLYGDAAYLYYVKEFLKNELGGTVTITSKRTSGTGLDANNAANSDQWTDPQDLAHGYAYFGITMPAVHGRVRSLVFQRGPNSVGYTLRIKQAWDAGNYNIAGGGTATQVPTLAGEEIVLGGGTDASPTFDAFFPSSGSYILHGTGYDDDPICGAVFAYDVAGTVTGGVGMFFALDAYETGTFDTDQDSSPLVRVPQATPSAAHMSSEDMITGQSRIIAQRTLGGEAFSGARLRMPVEIAAGVTNPYNSKKPIVDAWWLARSTAPIDPGGKSRLFKIYLPSSSVPRTGNLTSTKDKIIVGPLALPWDGTEPS